MPETWYVQMAGQVAGPLSSRHLKALADSGRIEPDQLVAPSPAGPWIPARRVRGLFDARHPAQTRSDGTSRAAPAPVTGSSATATSSWQAPGGSPQSTPAPPVYSPPPPPTAPPIAGGAPPPIVAESDPRGATSIGRKRRRSTQLLVVALSVLVLAGAGIIAVWALSSATVSTPSDSAGPTQGTAAGVPRPGELASQPVKVRGLDELLGQLEGQPEVEESLESTATVAATDPFAFNQSPTVAASSSGGASSSSAQSLVWHDASQGGVLIGDLEVQLLEVRLAPPVVVLSDGRHARTKSPKLIVHLRLVNRGEQRAIQYAGWSQRSFERGGTRVFDSANHLCTAWWYPGTQLQGSLEQTTIQPGQSVEDLLVFRLPDSLDGPLRLELSHKAIGGEGSSGLLIPAAMIVQQQPAGADSALKPENQARASESEQRADTAEQNVDDGGPIPIPGLHDAPQGAQQHGSDIGSQVTHPNRP